MPALEFPEDLRANEKSKEKKKIVCVTYKGSKADFTLEPYVKNRVVGGRPEDFIHISFSKLKFENDQNKVEYTRYIHNILTEGILYFGKLYLFCGHSNSQLRSRSCYLVQAKDHESIRTMINGFGDFEDIKDVAKRSKRVGLLFSTAEQIVWLRPEETEDTGDVIRLGRNFTDGCGYISEEFADAIRAKIINQRGNLGYRIDYVPKVFQIRYQGYKGTLMVEQEERMKTLVQRSLFKRLWYFLFFYVLFWKDYWKNHTQSSKKSNHTKSSKKSNHTKSSKKSNQQQSLFRKLKAWIRHIFSKSFWMDFPKSFIKSFNPVVLNVVFRPSMKKFSKSTSDELYILEHSKPTTSAKLNAELVSILSSLGVPDEVFERRLMEYYSVIGRALSSKQDAIAFLECKGRHELIEKLINHSDFPDYLKNPVRSSMCEELKTSFDKNDIERIHIMIPESRLLYGVCDSTGLLKEGQCFVKFTTNKQTLATRTLNGKLFVGRNPCLHPGDIQIFEAVDIPELNHLVDCIVFSTRGALPPASQMSGGDLDGDKFFVCWDKELIPPRTVDPFDYSTIQPTRPDSFQREISQLDMIKYFANYSNGALGQLTTLYSQWIRANVSQRAFSQECLELNILYSKCVDGEEVHVPNRLLRPPRPHRNNDFIVDKLIRQVQYLCKIDENRKKN